VKIKYSKNYKEFSSVDKYLNFNKLKCNIEISKAAAISTPNYAVNLVI
jgi:hypothetical protein